MLYLYYQNKGCMNMPILLDHQLKEQIPHIVTEFPITYYHDELESLPNFAGPFHWHPDFEIATAKIGVLDYQVGQQHIYLEAGDSIFVNGNMLHAIRQYQGDVPDPMPNIVFSGTLIASQTSRIYQNYILPIAQCDSIPFLIFRHDHPEHQEINQLILEIYALFEHEPSGFEMKVQRNISRIFEYVYHHLESFPKAEFTRIQIKNQIRFQKMFSFICDHYAENITLENIADAANIGRSEASRCFHAFMNCSPIDALIQYRIQTAHSMLNEENLTLQEISVACGFNSVNYFSRQFKKIYGYSPSKKRSLGK